LANRPIVTLTTDFGLADHFVVTVKGVILNIAPEAEIIDISHSVKPFDVLEGALTIAASYSYFPSGTIHLVVVDPGVGTSRRPIIATSERHHFVGPDNGVLSLALRREERARVFHVTAGHYFLQPVSQTFQARDIFGPVAAELARGVSIPKFGEEIADFIKLDVPLPQRINENTMLGEVIKVDHFGNLITNLTSERVAQMAAPPPATVKISIGGREITALREAYGGGASGELFGIVGGMGYLEIAANQASAAEILGVGVGAKVEIAS
jgi:S-adenosylmethionine hydrolase